MTRYDDSEVNNNYRDHNGNDDGDNDDEVAVHSHI